MKYRVKIYGKKVTKEQIAADIHRVAKRLGTKVVSMRKYQHYGKYSVASCYNRFGSWVNAIKAAGLKNPSLRLPPADELMDNIKRVWDKVQEQPTYELMKTSISKYRAPTYKHVFATWNNALRIFNLYVRKDRRKYEQEIAKLTIVKIDKRGISKSLKYDVFTRDKHKCRICGRSPATTPEVVLTLDHIKPVAEGGTTHLENLQTLCMRCNLKKGGKELRMGN
jgi:hypothetical protein